MIRAAKFALWIVIVLRASLCVVVAQSTTPSPDASFVPFQQWMGAVLTGDAVALRELYSKDPPAQIRVKSVMHDAAADTDFWLALKVRSMKVEVVRMLIRPDRASLIFRADVVPGLPDAKTVNVTDDQYWVKQGEKWRLIAAERTDAPALKHPSDMKKDIYPANADAHAEIKEAEERAVKAHKRLLLVFGANWCFDCHVLDLAFQRADLAPILAANYEIVHVDLGPDEHKNADLVQQYDIPLNKGIPALAVADSDGKLVVSQKNGEFEDARVLTPEFLSDFLNKWKPAHP
jgi:thioredoxin family protein